MPSRKRSQGRARKAAKCELVPKGPKGPSVKIDLFDLWASVKEHATLESRRMITGPNSVWTSRLAAQALADLITRHPEGSVDFVKAQILSCGTEILLGKHARADRMMAAGLAGAILLLEKHNPFHCADDKVIEIPVTRPDYLKMRNVIDGCERSVLRFYSKQTSCLDEKYDAAKSRPKTGICDGCGERKTRRELKICSRCRGQHYCSVKCQASQWPDHKVECTGSSTSADWLDGNSDGTQEWPVPVIDGFDFDNYVEGTMEVYKDEKSKLAKTFLKERCSLSFNETSENQRARGETWSHARRFFAVSGPNEDARVHCAECVRAAMHDLACRQEQQRLNMESQLSSAEGKLQKSHGIKLSLNICLLAHHHSSFFSLFFCKCNFSTGQTEHPRCLRRLLGQHHIQYLLTII